MSYDNCYFITLTLINPRVVKNFNSLIATYSKYVWVKEYGSSGSNPHFHLIIQVPKKIRTDNITTKFKSICYLPSDTPGLGSRHLVRTKYCYDFGTLYNAYFKKEKVEIHFKGWEKKVLDKLPVKDYISLSKIMKDKIILNKVNAPYVIYEYALRKNLTEKPFIDIVYAMIKDGYAISHLFGRIMKNVRTGYLLVSGNSLRVSWRDVFGEDEHY